MVLREQPPVEVITSIKDLLMRVARLYQIPGFKDTDAIELADWILERYPTELGSTVIRALKNPPLVTNWKKDQVTNWRLTPDTIGEWMSIEIEKANDELNNGNHLLEQGPITEKQLAPLEQETERLIENTIKSFQLMGQKPKPKIFLNRYNIGEECPKCKGSKIFNGYECNYCEGKGAIGIVEIKAETEFDAKKEYEKRFNVKL